MQNIKVKEVRGPLGKGDKKFYAVVDEKGGEFTTFDTKVKNIPPGSIIKIDPKIDGKYVNIASWEMVEEAANTSQVSGKTSNGKTSEDVALERASIEAQVAFKGAIRLLEAAAWPDRFNEEIEALVHDAVKWGRSRFTPYFAEPKARSDKAAPQQASNVQSPKEEKSGNDFDNAGQFLTKCKEIWSLDRSHVMEIAGVKELFDQAQFAKAYLKVTEHMTKK